MKLVLILLCLVLAVIVGCSDDITEPPGDASDSQPAVICGGHGCGDAGADI